MINLYQKTWTEINNNIAQKIVRLRKRKKITQKQLAEALNISTTTLNGYIQKEEVTTDKIKDYIVYPELGDNAGVVGALALAMSVVK